MVKNKLVKKKEGCTWRIWWGVENKRNSVCLYCQSCNGPPSYMCCDDNLVARPLSQCFFTYKRSIFRIPQRSFSPPVFPFYPSLAICQASVKNCQKGENTVRWLGSEIWYVRYLVGSKKNQPPRHHMCHIFFTILFSISHSLIFCFVVSLY
jgi:hypothetical protein